MFWPDLAEHYMNSIPLFFAIWKPSSYDTVRLFYYNKLLEVQIALIAHQQHGYFIVWVTFGFVEPLINVVEWLSTGNVVYENDSNWTTIIWACDWLECLLAGLIVMSKKVLCPRFVAWWVYWRLWWLWSRTRHRWWSRDQTWIFFIGIEVTCSFYRHLEIRWKILVSPMIMYLKR